jgi:GH15 family glucan-1,4-alpha-glucosidase
VHVRGPARPAAALDPEPLLRNAFAAIEACCAPNGAIAAAPPAGPGQPDYWFFWQRDAAAAAVALHALSDSGPADLRTRAGALCRGYLAFVDQIGRSGAVAAGRTTMGGVPVGGYGDPQHDGPAATVLAVLTLDPSALEVARPFLEHLLLPGRRLGFDLWELIKGRSFHAANLRRRALGLAQAVATDVDEALARRCRVTDERPAFVDPAGGWRHVLDPDPAWFKQTTRLDSSVLGSALLAFDGGGEIDHPCLTQTVRRLEEHYATKWPVNLAWRRGGNAGAGIGRFPEDANDGFDSTGGNPWPVATLWMAQYHGHRGNRVLAEGYLQFVTTHVDPGGIREQIDAVTGAPRGARGLVWAYAELVVALLGRVRRERPGGSSDPLEGRGGASI